MRHLILFLLFGLLSLPTLAQEDDFPMLDLPDAPLFSDFDYWPRIHQFAWLDNETLVFTPNRGPNEDNIFEAYQYMVSARSLISLETSPFFADWTEEQREYFHAGDYPIFRSPYGTENDYDVIYESTLLISLGGNWQDNLLMGGNHHFSDDTGISDYYHSIGPSYLGLGTVLWSQDSSSYMMELEVESSIVLSYSRSGFRYSNIDYVYDMVLGLSPNGKRVAIATLGYFSDADTELENRQKLIIWDASYHDDACACTYDPVSRVIYSEADNGGHNFAGVGFVDEDTILYIGNEGMYRHTIITGESTLLDPAFNTHWINLAIFSPDNHHVAVTTETGLYVLPTGFENP